MRPPKSTQTTKIARFDLSFCEILVFNGTNSQKKIKSTTLKKIPVMKNMRITCPTDKTIKSTASSVGISLPRQRIR